MAPNRWDERWMNRQQLLSRLAARYRIVYATGALSLWSRHDRAWRRAPWLARWRERGGVRVDEPGRLLSRWPRLAAWDRFVIRRSARRWLRGLAGEGPIVSYVFHPGFAPYADAIEASALVYHAYDLFPATSGWTAEQDALERDLVARADLCVGSSRQTVEHLRGRGARRALFLPNGVDYALFSADSEPPGDLERVAAPRIGYVGSVNRKLELSLLERLARARPAWSLVIIGPVLGSHPETARAWDTLQRLPNVHFLGERLQEEIPGYLAGLDVGLLPYRMDAALWTRGIYPLKLHEYLAAGLPVVSSDIDAIREFEKVVRIASDEESWLRSIDAALASGRQGADLRREVARSNDWGDRVRVLEDALLALFR